MTDNNENPPLIAEVLIATASKMAQDQGVKLVELMGHMEIAKLEVFNRNVQAARLSQSDAPAEGDDTVVKMDASPAVDEGKA